MRIPLTLPSSGCASSPCPTQKDADASRTRASVELFVGVLSSAVWLGGLDELACVPCPFLPGSILQPPTAAY